MRSLGIASRVDDSGASIGKKYARNDELGTPYGCTVDFACELFLAPSDANLTRFSQSAGYHYATVSRDRFLTLNESDDQ